MFLTNYFSDRRWRLQKEVEQKQTIIEQLYSPLYIFLEDLILPIEYLQGYVGGILGRDTFKVHKEDIEILEKKKEKISVTNLKKLIENKLGVIQPSNFREDLLTFISLLRELKDEFDIDRLNDKYNRKKRFENCCKALSYYDLIINNFIKFINEKIFVKDVKFDKLEYTKLLTDEKIEKLRGLYRELYYLKGLKKFSEKIDKFDNQALKDLEIEGL